MEKEEILEHFSNFIEGRNIEETESIWSEKSKRFCSFWHNKILNEKETSLNEAEVDQIIRILDKKAKGSTKSDQAVAVVMIPQGVWRRMFNEIKQSKNLRNLLTQIFESAGEDIVPLIDKLYDINKGAKNSLTGKSANALNVMLFAYKPDKYTAVVSLNDRKRIIDYFKFENSPDFEKDSPGRKVFLSNQCILQGFKKLGINSHPRIISEFLYFSLKAYWKTKSENYEIAQEEILSEEQETPDKYLFYMEEELENFLIANWDKIELGKELELLVEDGEMVSQQYQTSIGKIDILAIDKITKQYVIIELKKNQTSDDTIGQLARYMGWVEEHKSNGEPTKGIIIAAKFDERLYYALKKIKDVRIYLYDVDFKLKDFKKG